MIRNKTHMIGTLMVSASMASIDRSIVNISLPVIREDFGVGIHQMEWVITAYMLTFLLSIPLMGWLRNQVGYYKLLLGCLVVFTMGSMLCSVADTLPFLVFARMVQAAAGGTITPTSLAILSEYLPKEERGSAIGWWGLGNVMGPAVGPTLGGVLTHFFGWPAVFYVNIPLGILALIFSVRYLGFLKDKPVSPVAFDKSGYLLFAGFIIGGQLWVSSLAAYGIASPKVWALFLLTAALLAGFIRSSDKPDALLDLSVFRSATFNQAAVVIFMRSVALFGGMFYLPFLLQGQLGFSEIEAGLLMLPNALMMMVARPFAGKLADQGRIRNVSVTGIILVACSFAWFAWLDDGTGGTRVTAVMMMRGLGMGLLVAPVSTALLNAVDTGQTATATAMNSLLLQLGGSLGIAVSGVFHSWIYQYAMQTYSQKEAEQMALQGSFLIAAVLIAAALIPASRLPHAGGSLLFPRKAR